MTAILRNAIRWLRSDNPKAAPQAKMECRLRRVLMFLPGMVEISRAIDPSAKLRHASGEVKIRHAVGKRVSRLGGQAWTPLFTGVTTMQKFSAGAGGVQ